MEKKGWDKLYTVMAMAAVCALAVCACLFLYQYDNKYTRTGPQANGGILSLDEQALAVNPVLFLVEGWEYYGGQLLSPVDFKEKPPTPDEYIYIGQYGGFDTDSYTASPHGSASYRLTIELPDVPRTYMLELPEIFSAYKAYLNGELVHVMGDPDPQSYRAETGNRTVSVKVGGKITILIAVSDFSHMYSGMVYPPAFGEPAAVSALLSARLVFRSVLTAFALAVGILSLLVSLLSRKNALAALYGLLCLFFAGFTCYPIVRTLFGAFQPLYAVENISFCAMLVTVMLLQRTVFGERERSSHLFIGFGSLMCLASAAMPFLLPGGSLAIMGAYSYGIMTYEWITAAYLTVTAARTVLRGALHSKMLLGGVLIFDTALVMDRFLPLFEPAVTGWFPELASFVLVLCIGAVVGREVAAKYRNSAMLEERANSMKRLSELQRANYDLLMERIDETRTAQHDLRHHMVMIESFLQSRDYLKLEAYVRKFQASIQRIEPVTLSQNIVVGVLAKHYAQLAERHGIEMKVKLDIEKDIKISDADLCAILSNLLENAIEACLRQNEGKRYISLSIGQTPSALSIRAENSTDGQVMERGGTFLSSKGEGRKGYGLESVRATAKRYSGDAEFQWDNGERVFVSTVLLMVGRMSM